MRKLFFSTVFVILVNCFAVYSQQPEFLREYDLVPLPKSPPNRLIGSQVKTGGLLIPPPSSAVIDITESDSLDNLVIQTSTGGGFNLSAIAFKFLNVGLRQQGANFKLTKLPKLKVYQVQNLNSIFKAMGNNAGRVITSYIVAESFSFCSDEIDDLIIRANQSGANQSNSQPVTIERRCRDISDAIVPSVTVGTGSSPNPTASPSPSVTPTPTPADETAEKLKKDISAIVQEKLRNLGLGDISVDFNRRSNEVTVATAQKPVMVAWQILEYDPNRITRKTLSKNFDVFSPNTVILKDSGNDRYRVEIGTWDNTSLQEKNLDSRCVSIKVTALGETDIEYPLIPYCPTINEFKSGDVDLAGYVRNPKARLRESLPLDSFSRFDNVVKPRLSIKRFLYGRGNSGELEMIGSEVSIVENKTPYKRVRY